MLCTKNHSMTAKGYNYGQDGELVGVKWYCSVCNTTVDIAMTPPEKKPDEPKK